MRNVLIGLFLVFGNGLAGIVAGADSKSLSIVGISTPDGTNWVLGAGGVGRPFEVRVVLGNLSEQPVRIWRPESPDGAHLAWVTLRDADGREWKLAMPAKPRFGLASSVVVEPHKTAVYTLELLRASGIESINPGVYRLVGHYANSRPADGQIRNVWTGELASEPLTIRIERPPN